MILIRFRFAGFDCGQRRPIISARADEVALGLPV